MLLLKKIYIKKGDISSSPKYKLWPAINFIEEQYLSLQVVRGTISDLAYCQELQAGTPTDKALLKNK